MKSTAEELLDEIQEKVEILCERLENKEKQAPITEKKNSHLHLLFETSLMNKLKSEANSRCLSISELVRQKLRNNHQLDRIEMKIDNLIKSNC